jgi:hypothetical protein
MKKITSKLFSALIVIIAAFFLVLSIRGNVGNPTHEDLNKPEWKEAGPFELSPERGRFALMYSIVEDKALRFTLPVAQFATPDLGYKDRNYVSLFAPGVSYLIAPGYMIGKLFGAGQVGSFAVISLFALFNFVLIHLIAKRLGANPIASWIGSFVFLFATPAFSYAVSLYQHHVSTFLILMSIYLYLRSKKLISLAFIWMLIAASIPVDYPNLVLMLPIGILAFAEVVKAKFTDAGIRLHIAPWKIAAMLGTVLPLLFFFWFNHASYGNPMQLSGTVVTIKNIAANGLPDVFGKVITSWEDYEKYLQENVAEKQAVGFFSTRSLVNGFTILFVSPDRGIIHFTPVVLLAIVGLIYLHRKNAKMAALILSIMLLNIVFYGMWGDPWGGWAFGTRYLIPSFALCSILIAVALTDARHKLPFRILFLVLFGYSVVINSLGALTSNANPPEAEVLFLEEQTGIEQKYTYERNYDHIVNNRTKSFFYNKVVNNQVTLMDYWKFVVVAITLTVTLLLGLMHFTKRHE